MGEAEFEPAPSRKRKNESEILNSEVSNEKKAKSFCCSTFKQELRGSEALKSLKRFIAAAKNSDDVVYEYLESGGSLQEILSLIDKTAVGDLTTALPVFEVVHLILLRFQSPDSKYHKQCIESGRIILRSYLFIIKAMLTMNVTKQKKVALKVLTAITTLDSSFANEIINVMALSPALITDLIQPSLEKESVRKCFILFVLSFLVEGNLSVLKNLLDKKGFLSSIIPDLMYDEASTVNLTLSLLEEKILRNIKITKTLKLKIFNTQIVKSLFDLYDWKGLKGVKQVHTVKKNKVKEVEINQHEKEMVTESVHSFLLLLCCSQKFGIAFYDKSLGTSEQLKNQLLLTVFESIPDLLKNKKMAEVVLKTLASCPDLMKPVLLKMEHYFQPRNSKNWFQAIDFAETLIRTINVTSLFKNETDSLSAKHIIKVGKTLCAPVVFLRVAKLGTEKSQQMEIKLRSLRLLSTIWNEIQKLFETFQNFQENLKKSLHKYVFKSLPDAQDLVELWHTLCNLEFFSSLPFSHERRILFLSSIIESLHIILECQRDAISSPLTLASDLLHHIEILKDSMSGPEFEGIQVRIVQFVGVDLQALTSHVDLFEKCFLILLRSLDYSSITYLSRIMTSLKVFEGNKTEVDVWLLSFMFLPREYRLSVAEHLIECFRTFFKRKTENFEDVTPSKVDISKPNKDLTEDIVNDNDQTAEESPTPLIFNCVEVLRSCSSKLFKKDPKVLAFRNYVTDVIIHLQHFYTVNVYLYDSFVNDSKVLGKSALNYLKAWKNHSLQPVEPGVLSCSSERDLIAWLVDDEALQNPEKIIDVENTNLLQLHSLFRTVVAYLTNKTVKGDLSGRHVDKFVEVLSLLLCQMIEDDRSDIDLISYDSKNKAVYQRHCLNCLFQNKYLLKGFDIFQKSKTSIFYTTAVIFNVLMKKEIIKSLTLKKKLSEPWKCKFLKQLKTKLKKNKSIDDLDNLERVLNFFEYDHSEVAEVVELLMTASELALYVSKESLWTVILSKFIKMYCEKEALNEAIIKKLCLIVKHLNDCRSPNLEEMNNCFVHMLKKHPSHLLLIDSDFLKVILLSSDTTSANVTLGKLFLNDPNKVNFLLKFITENLKTLENPQIVFPLVSSLIVRENSFLHKIKTESEDLVWVVSEINTTSIIYKALEVVYKKFKKNILRALAGGREDIILKNLSLTRELIKLFLDKKQVIKIKKEISKGIFEPELLFEAVKKFKNFAVTENYVQGLLIWFCRFIKTSENLEEEVAWSKYCSIILEIVTLDKESSWKNIVDSPEWSEFVKLTIGHCLSFGKHSSLMKILRLLMATFYKAKEESKDCNLFFQMVISHSQFLRVMLSDSPLKTELVELFHCLIERSPFEISPKHFPLLLASYNASLNSCDRTILEILRFYERSSVGVSDYEPFVWGNTAVAHYSIGTSSGLSLWQRFNMTNVMGLLDSQRLELSLKEFPIHRNLEGNENIDLDLNVYDPAFLLPLFVNLLSPGSVVFCLSFIYKGGLAYTFRALSSECKDIRLTAAVVLARFYNHLELSQNLKQKLVWMHFINCFRFGIKDLSTRPLPNIATLFFARMSLELSQQPAEMYIPLQNFLLAKSYFVFDVIPEFLPLFHSSDMFFSKHRGWLLEVIRDGTKTASDISLIFHSMALKVVFCFFHSQLCDSETKKLILQLIERMLRIDKAILIISEYGLLNWIASINPRSFQTILCDLLNLLSTLTDVTVSDIQNHQGKHSNYSYVLQILNLAVRLLPSLNELKSIEAFKSYLNFVNKCFFLFFKERKNDWFKINKNWLSDIISAGTHIMGEKFDCSKYCEVPFYFRNFDEECDCEDLKNLIFLFGVLLNSN